VTPVVRSPCCLLLTCPAPLNIAVSGVNRHDSMLVEPILDSKPAIKGVSIGHPRRQPIKLRYDIRGYAATCAAAASGIAGSSSAKARCCPTSGWPCTPTAPP
jgi:hypothetical protein